MSICRVCGRPRLLDAYGGEGGAGKGYQRAGFCVSTVDNAPARLANYPLDCEGAVRVEGDAVEYILAHGHEYAVRATSPPCTGYTQATSAIPGRVAKYDRLIPATREALTIVGGPYVIENVTSAAVRAELRDPVMLCWTEFYRPGSVLDDDGTPLWMRRHRLFESNVPLWRAGGCHHPPRNRDAPGWVQCAGAYGGARRDKDEARFIRKGGYAPTAAVMGRLLGVDWMTETGCKLCIPPVYTEHIGAQLLAHVERREEVSC